ncbi:GRIP domain-containing protein [Schizosaccharomyces octosporus yFS286]|uniref:GRIP domain-containing protein n=1 Tax=Schizosaccharomyces octosporus (strain yFS286) TaxID=483514 RepID=S9RG71_SCHOY|nr:GRIP domain-containing protein [Schizosaccharomyces octosporus yFS286]EPX73064.1 GRIP domain-containing protein [Schizosaccharomyces octosporus yFS286]
MLGRLKDQFNMTLAQGQEEAKNRRRQLQEMHNQNSGSKESSLGKDDSEELALLQIELAELRETIDRFQTALQEKTPLSSITDIDGFLEYLDNLEQRYEISIREVKRLSNELQEADALFKASKKEFEEKFKELEEKFSSEVARLSSENQIRSDDRTISNIEEYISLVPSTPTVESKTESLCPEITTTSNKSSSKKKKRKNKKNQAEKHVGQNIEPTQEGSSILEPSTENTSEKVKENVQKKLSAFETSLQLSYNSTPSAALPTMTESEKTFLHLPYVPFEEALELKLEPFRRELETAEQNLKKESANFDKQDQIHKDNILKLNLSIDSLQKKLEESHQNLVWAETSCESLREEKQTLTERLANSEDGKIKLNESFSRVQRSLDLSQENLRRTSEELEKANGTIEKMDREVDMLKREIEKNKTRTGELNKKLVFATEQSNEFSRQVYETKEAIQTKQQEFEEVYKLLMDQTKDCQKLRSLVDQLEIDRIDSQKAAEVRLHELHEHYNTVLHEKDSALSELEKEKQIAFSELEHLKSKDEELTRQNQELLNGVQSVQTDKVDSNNHENEETLKTLEAEKKSLAIALDESTARYEHLQKSFKVVFGQHRRKQSQGSLSDRNSGASFSRTSVDQQNHNSMIDKEYTRNILFQFLEQRERRADIVNLLSILLELSTEQKEQLLSIKY